jgi:hypothetical protein
MGRVRQWYVDASETSRAEDGFGLPIRLCDQKSYERDPLRILTALTASYTNISLEPVSLTN